MRAFELLEVQGERLEVACSCGARYRLPSRLAGGSARCRRCKRKSRVPHQRSFSCDTRRFILSEFGIDARAAEQAYETEQSLRCAWCDRQVSRSIRRRGESKPLCGTCRDKIGEPEDDLIDMDALLEGLEDLEGLEELDEAAPLTHWSSSPKFGQAARKTLGYAFLFMLGFSGLSFTLFGCDLVDSVLVATAVAGVGACMVFQGEYGPSRVREAVLT